jgi:two-component system chemotaxis response regulator CheY
MNPVREKGRCVLVVDDDESIRRMLTTTLRRNGYEVREARNGREALDEMRGGGVELVVLDLMMPEVSGWDVLNVRTGEAALRRIPVIVVSAARGPEIVVAVTHGVYAWLPKPFDLAALQTLVASGLRVNVQASE